MQKSLKKTIALFLAVLMLMTCVPLNEFVGMDWSFFKASAVEKTNEEEFTTEDESAFLSSENKQSENVAKLLELTKQMKNDIDQFASNMFESCNTEKSTATMTTFSLRNSVATFADETDFMWEYDEETKTLTISGSGAMPDYESAQDDEIAVNTPWFSYATDIKKVVIEEGITSVGAFAFAFCTNLTQVVLPEGITSIGDAAFAYCFNLTDITLPSSIKSIGNMAFSFCWSVKELVLPDSIETIEDSAFMYMFNLERINIPENIQSLGTGSFVLMLSLKEVTVPAGVVAFTYDLTEDLSAYAFALESIINYSSTSVLDQSPEISFDNIEYAKAYSYMMSNYLKYEVISGLDIPGITVTETEFTDDTINYLNDKFNTSYIASDYDTIEDFFESEAEQFLAPHMSEMTHPSYYCVSCVNESSQHEFCKENLIQHKIINHDEKCLCFAMSGNIGENITWTIDSETKTLVLNGTGKMTEVDTSLNVYDDLIDHIVFAEDSSIESVLGTVFGGLNVADINIPSGVSEIDTMLMYCFGSVDEINVAEDNGTYFSQDGILFSKKSLTDGEETKTVTVLYAYPSGKTADVYTVPDNVYEIGSFAFSKADIAQLVINSNVKSVLPDAFALSKIQKAIFNGSICELKNNSFEYYSGKIYCYVDSDIYLYAVENEFGDKVIIIDEGEISSIEAVPVKSEYMQGDVFSLKDLTVSVHFADGTTAVRQTGFNVSGFKSKSTGICELTVVYRGFTDTYTVTIKEKIYQEISLGDTISLELASGKIEFVKFVPAVDGEYTFKSVSESYSDTYGYIYDEQMNKLAENDDAGGNGNFSVTYSFNAGKLYYLGAKYYSSSGGTIMVTLACNHKGDWLQITAPTCTSVGYESCDCVCCSEHITREIPMSEHSYEVYETVEATCTKNGTVTYKCTVCGNTLSQTVIAAHKDVNKDNICDICGKTSATSITKDSSVLITLDAGESVNVNFTPTYDGRFKLYSYTEDNSYCDTYCSLYDDSGNYLTSNDSGGSNGHFCLSYNLKKDKTYTYQVNFYSSNVSGSFYVRLECYHQGEWIQTVAPTCTTNGSRTCVCDYCGENVVEVINATGHSDTDSDKYCDICGEDICKGVIVVGEERTYSVDGNTSFLRFVPEKSEYINMKIRGDNSGYSYVYDSSGNRLKYIYHSSSSQEGLFVNAGETYYISTYRYGVSGNVSVLFSSLTEQSLLVGSEKTVPANSQTTYFKFVPQRTATYSFNLVVSNYTEFYVYDTTLTAIHEWGVWSSDSDNAYEASFEAGKIYYIGIGKSNTDSVLASLCPHEDSDSNGVCDECGIKMTDIIAEGTHGDSVTWKLTANGELSISGSGAINNGKIAPLYTNFIKSVSIDEGITSIGTWVFSELKNVSSITIPTTVTEIGQLAFASYTGTISVAGGENFVVVDGVLYDYEQETVIYYPESRNSEEYIMPDTVIAVESYAFYNCNNLRKITLPACFENIGWSFSYCNNLNELTILNPDANITYLPEKITVIRGYIGSTAEDMADKTGCTFIALDAKETVSIRILQLPSKVSYYDFESLRTSGLVIEITYDDGTTAEKTAGFTVSEIDQSLIGTQTITVTYKQFTAQFDITVRKTPNINLNETVQLDINGTNEEFVKFIPSVSGRYKFYAKNSSYDTRIAIYDADSNYLTGGYESANCSFEENKAYYVSARYLSESDNGTIDLIAECYSHSDSDSDDFCDLCNIDLNTVIASGTCGDSLTWTLNLKNVLEISGTGEMYDYDFSSSSYNPSPWYEHKDEITSVVVNDGTENIGVSAFRNLAKVTSVNLPQTIKAIDGNAFYDCELLQTVTIPNSVESIGYGAFEYCNSLTTVTIPDCVTAIGECAFYSCRNLQSVKLSDSLTEIDDYVFGYCAKLESVFVSAGVRTISAGAFYGCSELAEINVHENNEEYASVDGVLFNKDKTEILLYPVGKTESTYTIPESVVTIGASSFSNSKLSSIIIPGTVRTIGAYAFASGNLENVEIKEGVLSIGSYAFSNCKSLSGVVLPDSLTEISSDVFYSCENLKSLTVPGSVKKFGSYALYGCYALEFVKFLNPETIIYDSSSTIPESAVIYGRADSTAESYAKAYSRTFVEEGKLSNLVISSLPNRTEYYHIENFNEEGLVVKAEYDDNTSALVTEYEISTVDLSTVGEKTVTVSYKDLEADFNVNVMEMPEITNGEKIICNLHKYERYYYQYVPSVSGTYNVYFTNEAQNNINVGSVLYDSDLKSIGSTWFGSNDKYISYNFEQGKTYYIYLYSYSDTSIGEITIDIRCKTHVDENADKFCDVCGYDSAPSREEILPGQKINVTCSTGTVCYRFVPQVSQKYQIYSEGDYNTYIYLSDADNKFIMSDDNSGNDNNFKLEYNFVEGNVYYFFVSLKGVYETATFPILLECSKHNDTDNDFYCDVCGRNYSNTMASGKCGDDISWSLNYKGDLVLSGSGDMYDFNSYYNVPWYEYAADIKTVDIDENITSIASYSFYRCSKVTEVILPSGIVQIGEYTFYDCSLKTIDLPDRIISIGDYAFSGCDFTQINIPQTVETIGDRAFSYCYELEEITLPDKITEISDGLFSGCSKLALANLPEGILSIGDNAFYRCISLESVNIPQLTVSIGSQAFYNCGKITSLILPDRLNSIGSGAFYGCQSITNVVIPENVTVINSDLFYNCSSLSDVEFMGEITFIGDRAFSNCTALSEILLPDSLQSIGNAAFSSCSLSSIEIPAATVEIGTSGLNNAFSYCEQLREVNIDDENSAYTSVDGVWFDKDCTTLIMYPAKKADTDYAIDEAVDEIVDYAFYSQDYLETLYIPDAITKIGSHTFSNSEKLKSVRLPDELLSIGSYAFYRCSSLESISLPNSLGEIYSYAFAGCSSVTDITLPNNVSSIGDGAFSGCSSLQSLSILNPNAYIYASSYTIPSSARILGYEGSSAHNYAEKYSRDFNSLVSITDVEIISDLRKKQYTPFDKIETTGLVLIVYYEDGTSNAVNSGFTVSEFDKDTIGSQTLTVNYAGHTVTTDVEILDYCRLNISVVDSFGNSVPNALVTVADNIGNKEKKVTNKDGFVQIDMLSGDCYIGAMKGNDYIPITQNVNTGFGKSSDVQLVLVPHAAVEMKSEIREMDLDEILAAGVDVNAPENKICYEIKATVKYRDEAGFKVRYGINSKNEVIFDSVTHESSSSSGTSRSSCSGGFVNTSAGPAYAIIEIPCNVSYLKEFYHVKMYITFFGAKDMCLKDNVIKLDIPDGLTLMSGLNGDYIETETFEFDTLYGQETKKFEFILRGDTKGSYYFNAEYTGVLDFFDEEISVIHTPEKPIEVCGFDDVKINLNFCDEIHDGYLHYNISLLNEREKNIYCPNIDVGEITERLINIENSENEEIATEVLKIYVTDADENVTEYNVEYDEFGKPVVPIDTLKPNEKITYEYVSYYVFEEVDIGYLVEASADVLKGMAENVIVGTFHWDPTLGGAKKGNIELDEDIIFLKAGEEYQFNPTIKDKTPEQKVEWSISNSSIADISQNGLVKGITDGFAVVTVRLVNSMTLESDWDSCYVFVGDPSTLTLDTKYDSRYYYSDGAFYGQLSSVSDTLDIYYLVSNALDESIDDLSLYEKYDDELQENCKEIKPITVTAKVDGENLSFDSSTYSDTYTYTFDTLEFAHAADDILRLYPYNLDGNIPDDGLRFTVEVLFESESFEPFTETCEFIVESLDTKSANEHVRFMLTDKTYIESKFNHDGEFAIEMKNDGEYLWDKYTNLDIFTNYYEVVIADLLVEMLDAEQLSHISMPSLVPAYMKEWISYYKTLKGGIKTIADDDYSKMFDISETAVDKFLKKSKYLEIDDETRTDKGMQIDDKVRDWCLTAFKGKNGAINIEKINTIFAGIDKAKQGMRFVRLAFDCTNDIIDFCNKISLYTVYAEADSAFHEVMKTFADKIPDGKMKEAVYDFINYEGDWTEQLSTVFETTTELFKNVSLDLFKSFVGKKLMNYTGAKILSFIGNITLDTGAKVASTAAFTTVSQAFGGFFTGASLGICVSNILCDSGDLAQEMAKMVSMGEYTPYIVQTLEDYETNLINDRSNEAVDLYEYAFLLHKFSQKKVLDFTVNAMQIKNESVLSKVFKVYKSKNPDQLINERLLIQDGIEKMNCCMYADSMSTTVTKHRVVQIKCPVDVYIYDTDGSEVLRIIGDQVTAASSDISALVVDSSKYILIPADKDYTVKIVATDAGTMDYTVVEYEDGKRIRMVDNKEIDLETQKAFDGLIPQTYDFAPEVYALESDGNTIYPTSVIDVPVEKVEIDKTDLSMCIDESTVLTATVTPSDATVQSITFTSSDPNVVQVDENGTITAVSSGTAEIVVSTDDWGYIDICNVTVNDHELIKHDSVPSDCVLAGHNEYYECSLCGKVFKDAKGKIQTTVEEETLPFAEHSFSNWSVTAEATCTQKGSESKRCTVCSVVESRDTDALGHDYNTEWTVDKEATCTKEGLKSHHCNRCDEKNDITVIPLAEHSYEGKVTQPTCITNGYTTHTCVKCGYSYTDSVIEMTGHSEKIINKVDATCTEPGYTGDVICEVCNETITAGEVIKATGHSFTNYVSNGDATCTKDGTKTAKCDRCDVTNTVADTGSKLKHSQATAVKENVKKATCKANGSYDSVVYCSVCKAEISRSKKTIAKTGHTEKTTTTKATTSKDGKVVTTCSVCKKTLKTTTIYKASSIKLSKTSFTYNGKAQKPTVTVKNSKGTALKNGTNYTVSYSSGCKNTGKYAVKITFKGNYSGTKTLYFNILPGKTSKLTATQSTTSIKATWNKVTGASGYKVTLYNSKGKAVKTVDTTKTTYTFSKLSKGTTYKVRVTAYKTIDSKKVSSNVYTQLTTATKPGTPTLKATAGSKKAALSWNKQTGATGYVVYMATSKSGKYSKIATVKGKVSYTKTGLTKGKTYYFKVAAYKTVDVKNIYGSYSAVKSVKIK
ncbi:MAG: leucine-rich repeat protein [Acutalibacteraceae bacterium]